MTTQVKDLGSVVQIARYVSKGHPASLLFVPNDEVAGLCADLAEIVVKRVEARADA